MKKLLTRYIFDLIISTFFSRHYKNARAFYQDRPALALITHWVEGFLHGITIAALFSGYLFFNTSCWLDIGLHTNRFAPYCAY
ncbi:MAG: hypothetical protein BWY54_00281 [Candidatus Dependentiae bacterium ADurb.Bin331]|nr:MAG: hypothetical protein BWY54_00281 [Candidatus Dependentiae bacterium ADurb.Bin331]